MEFSRPINKKDMDSVPCLFSHYHYTTYNIDCLDEFKK